MKRIGILTHYYIYNYGAFLQGFALQEALKELYPDDEVYMINYVKKIHKIKNTLGWFRYNPKKDSIKSYLQKIKIPSIFNKIQKEYYNLTLKVSNVNELNNLGLDVIIVGSDEVWNYEDISNSPIKFADGIRAEKIIAYAPSTGKSDVEKNIPQYIKNGLKNFTALSARDDNSEKLIKNVVNKNCTRVLDPTLIYEFPEYTSEITNKIKKEKYILMYYCDNLPVKIREKIITYANKKGYKIYGAGEYKKWFTETFVDINPFEWVEMFKNAQMIFTGTFHGAVFSIKSKKEFYCFLTNESRIRKVKSLFKQFNISNRIINNENYEKIFNNIENNNIDYQNVYNYINCEKEKSLNFLRQNID